MATHSRLAMSHEPPRQHATPACAPPHCDTQLFCPTALSCHLTPWDTLSLTCAPGLDGPRMRADPAPPAQGSRSRTHSERVHQGGRGGGAGIRDARWPHGGRTPLVHVDHLLGVWRPGWGD